MYVKYSDIGQLNFARMQGTSGVSRSFDLEIEMKTGISITFSSIRKLVASFKCNKNVNVACHHIDSNWKAIGYWLPI